MRAMIVLILGGGLALAACGSSGPTGIAPTLDSSEMPSASTGASDAAGITLNPAPPDLGCDSIGVDYIGVTFRLLSGEPVSAVSESGAPLRTFWSSEFHVTTDPKPAVVDAGGAPVAVDGEQLTVPNKLHGYFVCFAPTSLYVRATDPSGG